MIRTMGILADPKWNDAIQRSAAVRGFGVAPASDVETPPTPSPAAPDELTKLMRSYFEHPEPAPPDDDAGATDARAGA
jgi:hypothetical protein